MAVASEKVLWSVATTVLRICPPVSYSTQCCVNSRHLSSVYSCTLRGIMFFLNFRCSNTWQRHIEIRYWHCFIIWVFFFIFFYLRMWKFCSVAKTGTSPSQCCNLQTSWWSIRSATQKPKKYLGFLDPSLSRRWHAHRDMVLIYVIQLLQHIYIYIILRFNEVQISGLDGLRYLACCFNILWHLVFRHMKCEILNTEFSNTDWTRPQGAFEKQVFRQNIQGLNREQAELHTDLRLAGLHVENCKGSPRTSANYAMTCQDL